MKHRRINRRQLLRGMYKGTAVGLGLPLLDLFLNDNGTALANGDKLPTCFGTWNWGLGLCPGAWAPEKTGSDYELRPQMAALKPVQDKINIYSGMQVFLDGPSQVHFTACQCAMTGKATDPAAGYGRTLDHIIGDKLSVRTRFPYLNTTCSGNPNYTWSSRGSGGMTPAEISPLALYQRIFGAGFQDPNSDEFTPDPAVMLRHSLLSYVADERQDIVSRVGADDKNKLDAFFTSLRDLEQKLALELEKPQPMAACTGPSEAPERDRSTVALPDVLDTHHLMTRLIAHALACGQTRIFNLALDRDVVYPGDPRNNHVYSHEEGIDATLGYQPKTYWFATQYMEAFRDLVATLDSIQEGAGTLLDRTLVMGFSDHGNARIHSVTELPLLTAGRANGGMKTGLHVSAQGDSITRVGLTCLQALGIPANSWGEGSNRVTQVFTEVLAS